jgi:glycosidase
MKLVHDLVPNHSNDLKEWFHKSVNRVDLSMEFYMWHNGKVNPKTGKRVEPNNWVNSFVIQPDFYLST